MSTTTKTITSFEVKDCGLDSAQYFRGAGTAFTTWEEVFVGCGDSPAEALDDALESAAMSGFEFKGDEPNALSEFGAKHANHDYVTEALDEAREDEWRELDARGKVPTVPDKQWTVALYPYNGCGPIGAESFDTEEAARAEFEARKARALARGQEVSACDDKPASTSADVQWPGRGVGDDEGVLSMRDNAGAIEEAQEELDAAREHFEEHFSDSGSELHYYVALYVSTEPSDASAEGAS